MSLASFINHPATDTAVMFLIIVSVVLLVLEETYPSMAVHAINDCVTFLFAVELSLRFLVARKKRRFFRRYWVDILAVLPLLRPLRFFRLFRFLRLLRLFRLFQLGMLLDRRFSTLRGILRVNFYFLWVLLVVTGIIIVGGGIMVFMFEGSADGFESLKESFWWAAHTLIAAEPVGGMPESTSGRFLLVGMMLSGMTLFAVFTGIVSATMMQRLKGRTKMGEFDIEELEDHIVVCGWNAGVRSLLSELAIDEDLKGRPVVLVNELKDRPDLVETGLRQDLIYHLQGDYTQLDVLKRAGIERATRAVVVADDVHTHNYADRDARSVLAALTIERMNHKREVYCVVELISEVNKPHLEVAGVEAVIMRNDLSGRALASACRHPGLMHAMMELITLHRGEMLQRFPGPETPMRFVEILRRAKAEDDALIIGVENEDGEILNPQADLIVKPTDSLLAICHPVE